MLSTSLLFLGFLVSSYGYASLVQHEDTAVIADLSPEQVLEVLTDFESTCGDIRGLTPCQYYANNVRDNVILEDHNDAGYRTIVHWQHVDAIRDSKHYFISEVHDLGHGAWKLTHSLASDAQVKALVAIHQLSHNPPPVESLKVTWILEPHFNTGTRIRVNLAIIHNLKIGFRIANRGIRRSMIGFVRESIANLARF